jgi:diadenosine tetraphosphate (Ap4A) HIT family hydrolase
MPVGDLALSRVLAMNDADFPWLILVPRRAGASEMIDLGAAQAQLMDEITLVSRALKDETGCDKLNVAAIGNVVPQLHIHIVARSKDDPLWPKPVWGASAGRRYEEREIARFAASVRRRIGIDASQ